MAAIQMIDRGDGVRLAARFQPGKGPTLLFLPGYMSDMTGSKAAHLLAWAAASGRACLLFDYSGCGASEGRFDDGSISRWAQDAQLVSARLAPGPLLPVGSSMGGWIMLRLALMQPARVRGLVGIAPAPDFVRWGLGMSAAEEAQLRAQGYFSRPSGYADGPYRYCRTFIEDAPANCLLDGPIAISVPVRLLHGTADDAVPVDVSLRLLRQLVSADVQLTLVKDGSHRLSAESDLELLVRTVESLAV